MSKILKKYCFALDLKEDEALIAEYILHHQNVWTEVLQSIYHAGIEQLEIYCVGNRLFMIMGVNENFTFEKKSISDAQSEIVQQWEQLMWNYQKPLPWAKAGEKWMLMEKIFDLNNCS